MSVGQFDRKQIIINSQFRDAGSTSTTDFTWRFQERIEGVRHAELRYFVFENGAYNITSSNNTFKLSEFSDAKGTSSNATFSNATVTIPVGAYDDTSLAETIGLALAYTSTTQTTSPNTPMLYLATFDGSGKISITCSANRSFGIWFDSTLSTQVACATVLGFTASTSLATAPTNQRSYSSSQAYTVFGATPQQLTNYDYLLVKSQKLGNDISFFSATGVTDQSAVIPAPVPNVSITPVKSPAGCFAYVPNTVANEGGNSYSIIYELQRPPQITNLKHPYSLDYVDIQICDKYGQVINAYTNNITIGIELFLDKKSENRATSDGSSCSCRS
jgi:hypothetical protein